MTTPTQLRAFHAVATEGGFTAAAKRLRLTQPALTLQVGALEQHYGVELFYRRGRQVILTSVGEQLLALTHRIVGLTDEAQELLSTAGGMKSGQLRLGADGPFHVIDLLEAFRARHPGVYVALTVGNSLVVRDALLAYETDVAVLAERIDHPQLLALPLRRYPVVLFTAKNHRWAIRSTIRLGELHGRPMLRREAGSTTWRAMDAALSAAGVSPNFIMEVGSREALREAVARGMGIGAVSEPELGHDDRLHALRIVDADVHTREYVVCLEERRNSPVVHAFMSVVRSQVDAGALKAKRGGAKRE